MGLYKTEGIVLRSRDYREADCLLTILARSQGKVQAIAKGVRKTRSRLRGGTQPFCHSQFVCYAGRNLDIVTQSDTLEVFQYLREDLERLSTASYLSELAGALLPERQPQEEVFHLLLAAFHLLGNVNGEVVARMFELRLLEALGYRPEIERCVNCGGEPGESAFFSAALGGVLCSACRGMSRDARPVNAGVLALIHRLLTANFPLLSRLKLGEGLGRQLEELLEEFITWRVEKQLNTQLFWRGLKRSLAHRELAERKE